MGGRLYLFISILSLLLLPAGFSDTANADTTDTIVTFTTGIDIHVQHYDIDINGKWTLERSFSFRADPGEGGTVGVTSATSPDKNGKFNVYYTFQNGGETHLGLARCDFISFGLPILKQSNYREFNNFPIYTHALSSNTDKFRIGFYEGENLFTSKIKSSGKPANAKTKIIDDDPNLIPLAGTFSWDGHVAAEVSANPGSENILDFQSLNGSGKPTGTGKRFLGGNVFQISAGVDFDGRYFFASRDFKKNGSKDTTSIEIVDLDTRTNTPLGGFGLFQGFKSTKFLNLMSFGSIYMYQDFLLYTKDKHNRLTLNVGRFDIHTGQHLGKDQALVPANDPILQTAPGVYGIFVVGSDYKAQR